MNRHTPTNEQANEPADGGETNFAPSRPARKPGRLSTPARVVVAVCVAAATAIGCGWYGASESVRFTSGIDGERAYARLPPLSVATPESKRETPASDYEYDYEAEERRKNDL
ncbi:MAG TPA: hypothetical protein VJT82_08255, partial [Pyrinomonadaceae bacterium]|nr:hypothetical protein [Pyrinomonadaceae bacterium]